MVFSASAKVASGVLVTSTAAVGTVLTYKYATDFYAIEKLALDEKAIWTVKAKTSSNPKEFDISLKSDSITSLFSNYGVSNSGSWICTVKTNKENDTTLKEKLKTLLLSGSSSDISNSSATDINNLNKDKKLGFMNSCARNRTGNPTSTNETVTAELILPLTNLENEIKEVFEGNWKNKQQ